jgi:hypothetical protein
MSEESMWGRVRKAIKRLDPNRVENRVGAGTPDTNYVEGWVELKWVRKTPKKGGVVVIEHWSAEQRIWHTKRRKAGGRSFVLLKIATTWMIFDGLVAVEILGKVNQVELEKGAIQVWRKKLNDQELRKILTN